MPPLAGCFCTSLMAFRLLLQECGLTLQGAPSALGSSLRLFRTTGITKMPDVTVMCPPLGESISEGTVSTILKRVGDSVKADEALAQLETDKVTIDIKSPAAGVVQALKVSACWFMGEVGSMIWDEMQILCMLSRRLKSEMWSRLALLWLWWALAQRAHLQLPLRHYPQHHRLAQNHMLHQCIHDSQ